MAHSATNSSTSMPVWRTESQIDPSWITQHFPNFQNVSECEVTDISNATRKGSKVRDGTTLRLTLKWRENGSGKKPIKQTVTLVAKQVPNSRLGLSRKLGLAREALFYDILAPKIGMSLTKSSNHQSSSCKGEKNDLQIISIPSIPKKYYSFGDMTEGSKFVVMEDLSRDFIDSGILFGPGNPNNWRRDLDSMIAHAYPSAVPSSYEVANQAFLAIANVHARFWRDKELLKEDYNWLRGSSWLSGNNEGSWWGSQRMIQTMWEKYLKDCNDCDESIQWDPLVRKMVEKAMKGISWESHLQRLNANTHFCLVHGDFWPGNIMISKKEMAPEIDETESGGVGKVRDLRLIDWEMVGIGSGPQDLGQYILSNMSPTERRKCEERLVRNYHEKLVGELGVLNFAWKECWSEYKIGGLERWIWFLVYFCAQPGPELAKWAQFFHNQIKEFVHDHNISPDDITQPRS